jgi:hypothetical protein
MPSRIDPKDLDLKIKFGAGLHTRASEDEIDPREAFAGENFLLDLENRELRSRPAFDLIGTVPNAAEVRGGGSLIKADGTVSTLFQAGNKVYEWNGVTTFTEKATVSATAKLRGHWRSHNWQLDNILLLTDVALVDPVKQWDGTTFASVAFVDGTVGESQQAFGTFKAKYLSIANERAIFSHVQDPSQVSKHMIVGTQRGEYTVISSSQRPSSSLSESDPFFLLMPDLRPINGHVEAFGTTVLSTEGGQLFNLTGASAKDFAFSDFYPGSAAAGDESIAYIGNDIIYGRQGRVESVRDTDRFGDSEADDLTRGVADQVADFTGWRIVYNSRLNRVYLFPEDVSEVWVFNNSMRGQELSPWMRWRTLHPLSFEPTFVMSMLDPGDGLEYTFMGDSGGKIYRLEGTGTEGDGGAYQIKTDWTTKLFSCPLDAQAYNISGYLKYRKNTEATVRLTFQYAGESAFDQDIEIDLPALGSVAHFGGDYFFGGDVYFGAPFSRLIRRKFDAAGQASELQLRVRVTSPRNFSINEIGLRFVAAS